MAWFTLCYGWRVGIVKYIFIVTATAAPTSDLTLPYLTLRRKHGGTVEELLARSKPHFYTASPCVYNGLVHIMLWVAGGNC